VPLMKRRASPIDSVITMLRVAWSSPGGKSGRPIGIKRGPMEMKALNTRGNSNLKSMYKVPLWLMSPLPGRAIALAVALRPLTRIHHAERTRANEPILPVGEAFSRMFCSSSIPFSPTSLKPAEIMVLPLPPASTHFLTLGTV